MPTRSLPLSGLQVAENPPVLHIPRVARPPVLEDFLEGSAPRTGTVVSAFLQRAPRDGDAISQPTTAYLSYDEHNLYVVFVCKDRDAVDPKQFPVLD